MMSTEFQALALSVILGLVQVLLAACFAIRERGLRWALSPREEPVAPLTGLAGRIDRAFYNFMETFPLFAALVLVCNSLGVHDSLTAWGVELYFWARVAYLPIYMSGVHGLRTVTWFVSVAGMVLLLVAIF